MLDVALESCALYASALECLPLDEGYGVACQDPVLGLEGYFWGTGVNKAYVMAPQKELKLPGSVSNGLLAVSGSTQSVCNRATTIHEMRSDFGRKHRHPSKLGLHEE